MKNGFILNLAYCRNCVFKMTGGIQNAPVELKEDIVGMVEYAHEMNENLKPCPERELVISYTNCIYE